MTNLGWGIAIWIGIILAYLVIRTARTWVKEFARQIQQQKMCEDRRCAYYQDYLQKGPALLTHSQYHEAVNSFEYWATTAQRCEDDDISAPSYTDKMLNLYRMQARM